MREPGFWWAPKGLAAALLSPLGWLYGAVAARRMSLPGDDPGIPVVCIGNLTIGGTGKTPTAILIARMLKEAGLVPHFLSRGYGGRMPGPVAVDRAIHGAADVGDEPLLLAREAPAVVARDRTEGARLARDRGAGVVVMDDGFQNPSLAKDCSIVVVDARRGIGNGCVFPAGPLRAPLGAQLDRAHALVVVGEGDAAAPVAEAAARRNVPVLRARLVPDAAVLADLRGRPLLAFAGIGDPQKFFATLTGAGLDLRASLAFPDHHRYRRLEATELAERALREGLVPVTTEKDAARLAGDADVSALAAVARALPVTMVPDEPDALRSLVLGKVRRQGLPG